MSENTDSYSEFEESSESWKPSDDLTESSSAAEDSLDHIMADLGFNGRSKLC